MVESRNIRRRSKVKAGPHHRPGIQKSGIQPLQTSYWKNPMQYSPGGKRGPEELVKIQRSPPSGSRNVHPDKWKIKQRQQDACMDQQGDPN